MVVLPKCGECKNYIVDRGRPARCKAYPDGIPKEWFLNGDPEEGDECNNGIGFEQDD